MAQVDDGLDGLLRCELTAVHQQFTHVLALNEWGLTETADRIMDVDYVDFPNAMRIIDYLVRTGKPLSIDAERPSFGYDHRSILIAEQNLERRLTGILDIATANNDQEQEFISVARAPREAYARWLTHRIDQLASGTTSNQNPHSEIADLYAHLLVAIEQTLCHAFVHWHHGERSIADAAWAVSGAAMVQGTDLVRLFAAQDSMLSVGSMPPLLIATDPGKALENDRTLAALCAQQATKTAETCGEPEIASLCRKIADQCRKISEWQVGEPHPAVSHNPPAFASFEATLRRYVWSSEDDRAVS